MAKPYKTILSVSLALAISMCVLMSSVTSVLNILFAGLILFIIFSAVYSGIYFVIHRGSKPYGVILAVSVAITALLFIYDSIYDNIPPGYTWKTHVFESVVYGTLYTAIIFGVFSLVYFGINKLPD